MISNLDDFSIKKLLERSDLSQNTSACIYKDSFIAITNIDNRKIDNSQSLFGHYPIRMKDGCTVLCRDGEFEITCDLQKHLIKKNMLFFCKPGSIVKLEKCDYCNISVMIASNVSMESLQLSVQKLVPHFTELQHLFCINITEEETNYIHELIKTVITVVKQDEKLLYYNESVCSIISTCIYSLFSLLSRYFESTNEIEIENRERKYLRKFLHLVYENFRKERAVGFYAKKMHISSKYLSSVVKNASNKTPSQLIDDMVVLEIKHLLRYSDLSVQEIAYNMNFTNQSFFGKYFKRLTGMSPRKYKTL